MFRKIIHNFKVAFSGFQSTRSKNELHTRRRIITLLAAGNVSLQNGSFTTEAELDKRRKRHFENG
jgi:hypothetical protein